MESGEPLVGAAAPSIAEARRAGVLDAAGDGLVLIDDWDRIVMVNRAAAALFGHAAADLVGCPVSTVLDVVARQGHAGDGTAFPVAVTIGDLPERSQTILIVRDLRVEAGREQRADALQAELLRMARVCAIGEMGATLAHELSQPLTAVMLYVQTLERVLENDVGVGASLAQQIAAETERVADIVALMRAFMDDRAPGRRRIDLGPLVDGAVRLTQMGTRPVVPVAHALTPGLPQVQVDPIQIQQVLVSLLRQALAAVKGREQPDVRVAAALESGAVALHVVDNGPGIAPEDLPHLFTASAASTAAAGT